MQKVELYRLRVFMLYLTQGLGVPAFWVQGGGGLKSGTFSKSESSYQVLLEMRFHVLFSLLRVFISLFRVDDVGEPVVAYLQSHLKCMETSFRSE
jgi:hypothetical protein